MARVGDAVVELSEVQHGLERLGVEQERRARREQRVGDVFGVEDKRLLADALGEARRDKRVNAKSVGRVPIEEVDLAPVAVAEEGGGAIDHDAVAARERAVFDAEAVRWPREEAALLPRQGVAAVGNPDRPATVGVAGGIEGDIAYISVDCVVGGVDCDVAADVGYVGAGVGAGSAASIVIAACVECGGGDKRGRTRRNSSGAVRIGRLDSE